jgi:ABC-type uncharacterized transport system auxiliary subunit
MIDRLSLALVTGLLAGCMALPGSDVPAASRYMLKGPETACEAATQSARAPLLLSVPRVSVGLDTDRIARRSSETGEIAYLRGARWADSVDTLVSQRLARDLECEGFTVLSSHHHKLGQQQLVCEVRALNLVESGGRNEAEVGLSCLLYRPGAEDRSVVTNHRRSVGQWSVRSAVAATSEAYQAVLADLIAALR